MIYKTQEMSILRVEKWPSAWAWPRFCKSRCSLSCPITAALPKAQILPPTITMGWSESGGLAGITVILCRGCGISHSLWSSGIPLVPSMSHRSKNQSKNCAIAQSVQHPLQQSILTPKAAAIQLVRKRTENGKKNHKMNSNLQKLSDKPRVWTQIFERVSFIFLSLEANNKKAFFYFLLPKMSLLLWNK